MGVPDQTSWFRSIKANIRSIKANDQMGVPDQTCWFKSIRDRSDSNSWSKKDSDRLKRQIKCEFLI